MTNQCPPELRRLYHQGRVIPFVGAGASMAVTWGGDKRGPSWRELVTEAGRQLGFEDSELLRFRGTDLQILEYMKAKLGGLQPLINWLHANMQPLDADLRKSVMHNALAQLAQCKLVYTTNYDNFLERAFRLNGRAVTVVKSEHDLSALMSDTQIVKFHGDFDHPDAMVLSESDYETRMNFEGVLDLKLRSDILGRVLLFIGYSFRDANVAYLFRLVNERFKALPQSFVGRRAYIIYQNPSDFERTLFHSRQIEVVPIFGGDQSTAVTQVLQDMSR